MRYGFALLGLAVVAGYQTTAIAAAEGAGYQRDCKVVDGTVVCKSLTDDLANLEPQKKGLVVYDRSDKKHGPIMGYGSPGYGDSQSRLVATITDSKGHKRFREVRLKYLENTPEGNMRLVIFDKPKDLKRHALLTISHKQGLDEQWRFDPATKKVQRIQSNNDFTPFSGTDIAFEDLSSQDIGKYDYKFVKEESLGNTPCYVVNRIPKSKYSGYSRLETWISKDKYLVQKINYYDRKGRLLKTLTLNDYQLYDDKFWRASTMRVENHRSGSTTQLKWSDYEFNTGLTANDFSLSELRNIN